MTRKNDFFKEVEQLFNQLHSPEFPVPHKMNGRVTGIPVDVVEDETEVRVTADLPGYNEEDIELEVHGRTLVLSIESESESVDENQSQNYLRQERTHESMKRSVYLPEGVDVSNAEATYNNGVLNVTFPLDDTDDAHSIEL